MGALDTGDVVTLLAAVVAVAVCVRVGAESVRRVRGHRFDHPSALLDMEGQEGEHALRRGFLERRYALVETAGARVRERVRPGAPGATGDGLPDPVRVVDDLDRDLARLEAGEGRAVERSRAALAERRERAGRARSTARLLDLVCTGAAVLLAGAAVGTAVAAVL